MMDKLAKCTSLPLHALRLRSAKALAARTSTSWSVIEIWLAPDGVEYFNRLLRWFDLVCPAGAPTHTEKSQAVRLCTLEADIAGVYRMPSSQPG